MVTNSKNALVWKLHDSRILENLTEPMIALNGMMVVTDALCQMASGLEHDDVGTPEVAKRVIGGRRCRFCEDGPKMDLRDRSRGEVV